MGKIATRKITAEQAAQKIAANDKKVFLTELEKEKLQELQQLKNNLTQAQAENGALRTELILLENTIKEKENLAVNTKLQINQIEQNIIKQLQEKYGQNFQLGNDFEVITEKGN